MIKAIFFDIDGTLVSHQLKDVPLSTRQCIEELKEKGIKVFISTGRHLVEMRDLPTNNISFDGYVTLNGNICLDQDYHYMYGTPFSKDITDHLVSLFEKKEVPLVLVESERFYLNYVNQDVELAQAGISTPIPDLSMYQGDPVFQGTLFVTKQEEQSVAHYLPEGCKFTRWSPYGVDIISTTGGKVNGIEYFLKHYGIDRHEIMAFGDSDNDMDMLEYAGIGVAMGNAHGYVKDIADYVTTSVDDDGIAHALKHFGVL